MKTKILVSFFILVALSACGDSSANFASMFEAKIEIDEDLFKITFRINGTVTDATDNSPVKRALVVLYKKSSTGSGSIDWCYTGAEGRYRIDVTTATWPVDTEENYWLHVRATGYKERYIYSDEKEHVRLTEELQTIDIQLEPK